MERVIDGGGFGTGTGATGENKSMGGAFGSRRVGVGSTRVTAAQLLEDALNAGSGGGGGGNINGALAGGPLISGLGHSLSFGARASVGGDIRGDINRGGEMFGSMGEPLGTTGNGVTGGSNVHTTNSPMTINMTPIGATALHMMSHSYNNPHHDTTPLTAASTLAPINIYRFDAVHQVDHR